MRTDRFASWLLIVSLGVLPSACGGPAKGPERPSASGEWHTFEGTGSATGQAQTLHLGPGHAVAIFNLTGPLLLTGERGLGQGFRSEVIGYTDSLKGGRAWCVWTDSRGDQVFSELQGGPVSTGNRFAGTLLGGTGRYARAKGDYAFEWQYVVRAEDGHLQGRVMGLRGRFREEPSE